MQRQYHSQRIRGGFNPRKIGPLNVGAIYYVQDGIRPFSFPRHVVCREPWIVVAFKPEQHPHYGPLARTGNAVVKSLRTGRIQEIAPWILQACDDAGLERN